MPKSALPKKTKQSVPDQNHPSGNGERGIGYRRDTGSDYAPTKHHTIVNPSGNVNSDRSTQAKNKASAVYAKRVKKNKSPYQTSFPDNPNNNGERNLRVYNGGTNAQKKNSWNLDRRVVNDKPQLERGIDYGNGKFEPAWHVEYRLTKEDSAYQQKKKRKK